MVHMTFSPLVAKCLMNLFNNRYVGEMLVETVLSGSSPRHLTQQEINPPLMPFHLFVILHSSTPFRSTEHPGILKAHYMISLH